MEARIREAFAGISLFTVQDIADKMEVPYKTLDHWLKGRRDIPNNRLIQIAELTGYSVHWLLTGNGEKKIVNQVQPPLNAKNVGVLTPGPLTVEGDVVGKKIITTRHIERPRVEIPEGSLNEEQAAEIKQLLDDLGEKLTRRDGKSGYGNAHGSFKKYFDITSYKTLQSEKLGDAKAYLKRRIKAVEGDLKKLGINHISRAQLIKNIQTFCRKELKWDAPLIRRALIDRVGRSTIEDCDMYELESFCNYLQDKVKRQRTQSQSREELE